MVKIVIENLAQKEIIINDPAKPVLRLIQESGTDWMTGCGGKGRCTTCRAIVVAGAENLTPISPAETKYRDLGLLLPNERLMCQARTKGDLVLRVPDDSKLPHMKYSE
ncbi:MAG: 2Fe-2S iron-sulfur cluster-binding protein [Bacteroidota bacterium]